MKKELIIGGAILATLGKEISLKQDKPHDLHTHFESEAPIQNAEIASIYGQIGSIRQQNISGVARIVSAKDTGIGA